MLCVKSLQSCPTLCDPNELIHQALLSMGFSRHKYWGGLPFPPLEDFPTSGIIPCPGAPGFLPARARPLLGAGGGGVAFPGGAASLAPGHSDSALTDRHQMLFRAALRSARRFRFSIDRRKPGKGESVDVTSPQPQARGWGPGRDGCQTVRIWSFANRGGWGNVTSPRVSLSAQQS